MVPMGPALRGEIDPACWRRLCLLLLLLLVVSCAAARSSSDGGGEDLSGDSVTDRGPEDRRLAEQQPADGKPEAVPKLEAGLEFSGPDAKPDGPPPDLKPDQLKPDLKPPPDVKSPDSNPGKICDNGKDDDGDGKVDCIDLTDCGSKSPCLTTARILVIHEVSTGSPNYVVLRNASTTTRSIGNYVLEMSGGTTAKFTLPVQVLAPGKTVTIVEYSGKSGEVGTGKDIPFSSGTSSSHYNSVLLRSPGKAVVDYVGFGKLLVNIPSSVNQVGGPVPYGSYNPNSQSYYRAGMKGDYPSFRATDWHKYKRSR